MFLTWSESKSKHLSATIQYDAGGKSGVPLPSHTMKISPQSHKQSQNNLISCVRHLIKILNVSLMIKCVKNVS